MFKDLLGFDEKQCKTIIYGRILGTFFFFFFLLLWVACRILASQPEFEPGPWAVNSQSANHWAARELP